MNASICLSFGHDFYVPSYFEPSTFSNLIHRKHQAAMKEALEILCNEGPSCSEIEEILKSVRQSK